MVCYNLVVTFGYHPVVSCAFPSPSHRVTFVPISQLYVSVRTFSSQPPIAAAAAVIAIKLQSVRKQKETSLPSCSLFVEQTVFLRLSKHHIFGLNKVFLSLHGLKEEGKANADAAVAAKNSVSGDRNSPIISVVE